MHLCAWDISFKPCTLEREFNASIKSIDPDQPARTVQDDLSQNFLLSVTFLHIKVSRPPEDQIDLIVLSLKSTVLLGETTLTISDSIETGSPVETEIVRVVSLSISTEI